jgi:hypothetical protein
LICFVVGKTWDNSEDLEGEKEEKWLRPSGLVERNWPHRIAGEALR